MRYKIEYLAHAAVVHMKTPFAANLDAVAGEARSGEQRWTQTFEPKSQGIGTPVRGVGYADGRLFRGTPDGHLLALLVVDVAEAVEVTQRRLSKREN